MVIQSLLMVRTRSSWHSFGSSESQEACTECRDIRLMYALKQRGAHARTGHTRGRGLRTHRAGKGFTNMVPLPLAKLPLCKRAHRIVSAPCSVETRLLGAYPRTLHGDYCIDLLTCARTCASPHSLTYPSRTMAYNIILCGLMAMVCSCESGPDWGRVKRMLYASCQRVRTHTYLTGPGVGVELLSTGLDVGVGVL